MPVAALRSARSAGSGHAGRRLPTRGSARAAEPSGTRASRRGPRADRALDPLGDRAVLLRPVGARDLAVRDVADERVREGELALALERRAALAADEALALERVERGGRGVRASADRARPEDLADDGCVLKEALLGLGEPVETGGDDALQRLRERQLLRRSLLDVELDELLRVERVAAGPLEQGCWTRRRARAVEQAADQLAPSARRRAARARASSR